MTRNDADILIGRLRSERERAEVWWEDCKAFHSSHTKEAEQTIRTLNRIITLVEGMVEE